MTNLSHGQPQRPIKVLMIDNYDSFTWNLYQYLCLLGAEVKVVRSQSCTLEELISSNADITHLVISPGPGHPTTDSGISIPALLHYAGKLPILGICMGLQCIYAAFGGEVSKIGEIVHGKTSPITHDQQGLFAGLTQGIQSTRYHSLAGRLGSLPAELVITSWTDPEPAPGDPDHPKPFDPNSSVIMGVRHKLYTIEAVQYHPESILSEEGKQFLSNFLSLRAGRWSDHPELPFRDPEHPSPVPSSSSSLPTILQNICRQRTLDIAQAKAVPGASPADLTRQLAARVAPTQIDFYERIRRRQSGQVALMAEIKRASPSKGSFVTESTPTPPEIACSYAAAGASVISVLTEPTWFKGTLMDMLQVRLALENVPDRPAILRKDFILDTYQIDEARCYGADTVLLIVACLTQEQLATLFNHAKALGIEPLVEVNNTEELERALELGALVIGVNNRNLHDFKVDMQTTSNLVEQFRLTSAKNKDTPNQVIMCALSGISGRPDVERYAREGVGAVLVGESMMKADNKIAFVHELLGIPSPPKPASSKPLVKICGIKTPEMALHAAHAGADLIGLIFVSKSRRYVSPDQALSIIRAVRSSSEPLSSKSPNLTLNTSDWFTLQASRLLSTPSHRKPLFVGVFQDASLQDIQLVLDTVPLDLIQLHGHEPISFSKFIPLPVIKTFHVPIDSTVNLNDFNELFRPGYHALPLLDSKLINCTGGTGKVFDWNLLKSILPDPQTQTYSHQNLVLAGGLNCENVSEAIKIVNPLVVDVSGGVEDSKGDKDQHKISKFISLVNGD